MTSSRRCLVALGWLLAGCGFHPQLEEGRVTCQTRSDCPAGFGFCMALGPEDARVCCRTEACGIDAEVSGGVGGAGDRSDAGVEPDVLATGADGAKPAPDSAAADAMDRTSDVSPGADGPGPADAPIERAPADGPALAVDVTVPPADACDPSFGKSCNSCGGVYDCNGTCPKPLGQFGTPVLLTVFNSTNLDYYLSLSADELGAYVTSNATPANDYDIFFLSRTSTSSSWSGRQRLQLIDTTSNDARAWVSADDLRLYYENDSTGPSKISLSSRVAKTAEFPAGKPVFIAGVDARVSQSAPTLSADEQRLYFHADSARGNGLFVADRTGGVYGFYGTPRPIPGLGTLYNEQVPVLSRDELTIYFEGAPQTADQHASDIYIARRRSIGDDFGPTTKVDVGVISLPNLNEHPTFLSADECTLYFAREGAAPSYISHLYSAKRTP
jgi:hypothetical protein